RRVAVRLGVVTEVLEARVAPARACGRLRIDVVEVVEDALDRRVQAVEVEPVEADLLRAGPEGVVVPAQPADEVADVGVAPHPGGKAPETGEGVLRPRVVARAPDVA